MYKVYVIRSVVSGRRYVGLTGDLEDRLARHNNNRSWATKGKGPWVLLKVETFATRDAARAREKFLKTGKGREMLDRLFGHVAEWQTHRT